MTTLTYDFPYTLTPALQMLMQEFAKAKAQGEKRAKFGGKKKQTHLTHDEALAKARALQYSAKDMAFVTPFQMPTHAKLTGESLRLPASYLEQINKVRFGVARDWDNQRQALGEMYLKLKSVLNFLNADEYEAACAAYPNKADIGAVVADAFQRELHDLGAVKDEGGFPLDLGLEVINKRVKRLEVLLVFSAMAAALNKKIQDAKGAGKVAKDEGRDSPRKGHKRERNQRDAALKAAVAAIAAGR